MKHDMDCPVQSIARQLRGRILDAKAEIKTCKALIQSDCRLLVKLRFLGGNRWINVKEVDLEAGRTYLVRRIAGRGKHRKQHGDLCLAIWGSPRLGRRTGSNGGWREIYGNILEVFCPDPTIEVWAKKRRTRCAS